MSTSSAFWGAISGIAVVNLDHRTDRWRGISEQAAQLSGPPPLTRIAACQGTALPGFGVRPWFRGRKTDGRWAARAGCVLSHRRVMQHARAAGWETTLVLEDDCDLTPLAACDLEALHRFLFVEHPEWDVCYLGHNEILPPAQRVAPWGVAGGLFRVRGCATTHAYLVRRPARDWIMASLPEEAAPWRWLSRHRAVDRWYARVLSRRFAVWALSPSLLLQRTDYSDIGQEVVDWSRMELVPAVPSRFGFRWRLRLAHARGRLAEAVDEIRSWRIRLRGF